MYSDNEIKNTLKEIIEQHTQWRYPEIQLTEFSDSDLLEDTLHMDSLDVMDVIMLGEDALNIDVPNKKIHDIKTFGNLCNLFIESRV